MPPAFSSFDPTRLMEQFGRDENIFIELVAIFFSNAKLQYQKLATAVNHQKWTVARREAHTLKSNLAAFDALKAVEQLRQIEQLCEFTHTDVLQNDLRKLKLELFIVATEMKAYCDGLSLVPEKEKNRKQLLKSYKFFLQEP